MAKFIIEPHGRLQEMVAHESGFFTEEGLDYDISRGNIGERTKPVNAAGQLTEIFSGRLSVL